MDHHENRTSYWTQLGAFLKERTVSPLRSPSFVMFFFLAVLICGGLGIWVEIARAILGSSSDGNGILLAVNVFYPSVGCAAAIQFIFNRSYSKSVTALASVMAALFIIGCIVLPLTWAHPVSAVFAEIVLSLAALWAWWVANATNPELLEEPPPHATGPSDPAATRLAGGFGDLKTD